MYCNIKDFTARESFQVGCTFTLPFLNAFTHIGYHGYTENKWWHKTKCAANLSFKYISSKELMNNVFPSNKQNMVEHKHDKYHNCCFVFSLLATKYRLLPLHKQSFILGKVTRLWTLYITLNINVVNPYL